MSKKFTPEELAAAKQRLDASLDRGSDEEYGDYIAHLAQSRDEYVRKLEARVKELKAEVSEHRERANSIQTAWEGHKAQDCALRCAKELTKILGTDDPVEAARKVKKLEAQYKAATKALKNLRDLLPEFGGLDGRVWRIIDEAIAILEGDEQDA